MQCARLLAGSELEYAIIEKEHAQGQIEGAAGQGDIQGLTGAGAVQGAWRLMINRDLAISITSEADQAVGHLCRLMQLAEARKLPRGRQVHGRALVAVGFALIQHASTQGCGDADHGIQPMAIDEVAPLGGNVQFILGATILAEALCTPSR